MKVIENDNIKDLFSNGLENHTTPVRPEVWNGLQAKMAAAGVASASAAGVKGISALAKWIIGGAAASAAVVTTVVIVKTQDPQPAVKQATETAQVVQPQTQSESTATTPSEQPTPATVNEAGNREATQPTDFIPPVVGPREHAPWETHAEEHPTTNPNGNTVEPVQTNPASTSNPQGQPSANERPITQDKGPETKAPTVSDAKITKIPNFFSPNNDGDNDLFYIESQNLNDFSVTFLDPKGGSVWSSNDPNFKWDGTNMGGEPVEAGRYICMIVARDSKGEIVKEYRYIEIRR